MGRAAEAERRGASRLALPAHSRQPLPQQRP
eukprot:COSAG01_NODE_67191_length_267_cov_9.375000_1_plen_30_part_10